MTKRKTTKHHLTDDVFNFLHAIPLYISYGADRENFFYDHEPFVIW